MTNIVFELKSINQTINIYINQTDNIFNNFNSLEKDFRKIHHLIDEEYPKNDRAVSSLLIDMLSNLETIIPYIKNNLPKKPLFVDENTPRYLDYYNNKSYTQLKEIFQIITYLIKDNFGSLNIRSKLLQLAKGIFNTLYSDYERDKEQIKNDINLYEWLNYYDLIPSEFISQNWGYRTYTDNTAPLSENLEKFYNENYRKIYLTILNIGIEYGKNNNGNSTATSLRQIVNNQSIQDWLKLQEQLNNCENKIEQT